MKLRLLSQIAWCAAVALVLAANLIVAWRSLTEFRFWEDEAYNLTVPLNLVRGLGYSSDALFTAWMLDGTQVFPFDSRISTGPPVLIPSALVLQISSWFGIDMWGQGMVIAARLVPLAYWVLLLAGLFVLGRRISGRWGALLAATTPLIFTAAASNSPVQGPADLLGEIPTAALLVWAFIALRTRPWLAGLIFGLAIQTKYIALLAAPALVCAALLLAARPLREWWRTLRTPIAFTILPTLLVELIAFVTLGPSVGLLRLIDIVRFLVTGGPNASSTIAEKLDTFMHAWFVPAWVAWLMVVLAAILLVSAIVMVRRHPSLLERARQNLGNAYSWKIAERRELLALFVAAALGALAFIGWWATARHTPLWVRHPAPGIYAFVPLLAAFLPIAGSIVTGSIAGVVEKHARAKALKPLTTIIATMLTVGLAGTYLFALQAHVQQSFADRWQNLSDQHHVATIMRQSLAAQGFTISDWIVAHPWGAPVSIAVMTGHHVGLADHTELASAPIISDHACDGTEPLEEGGGYVLCLPTATQ